MRGGGSKPVSRAEGSSQPNRRESPMITEQDFRKLRGMLQRDKKTPRGLEKFAKHRDYYDYAYMCIKERQSKGERIPFLDKRFIGYYELYKAISR